MTTVTVQSVTPADAAAWVAMRTALWPEDDAAAHTREAERFFAGTLPDLVAVLVAWEGSRAVGFVELNIRSVVEGCTSGRVAYLEGWYVVPEARRQGVGRALIQAAETWGRGQGCTEFGSDVMLDNDVSAAAHRALDFEEVAQIRCFRKDL